MLDPFYLAIAAFAIFIFSTLIMSALIKKFRNRRRTRRPSTFAASTVPDDTEARTCDGPVNLYEAKATFEYDPDLLVSLTCIKWCSLLLILCTCSLYREASLLMMQGQMD